MPLCLSKSILPLTIKIVKLVNGNLNFPRMLYRCIYAYVSFSICLCNGCVSIYQRKGVKERIELKHNITCINFIIISYSNFQSLF